MPSSADNAAVVVSKSDPDKEFRAHLLKETTGLRQLYDEPDEERGWVVDAVSFDGLVTISATGETKKVNDKNYVDSIEVSFVSDSGETKQTFAPGVGLVLDGDLDLVPNAE